MPFAAYLIGTAYDRGWGSDVLRRFAVIFVGTALVIVVGALWLQAFTGSLKAAFAMGALPFIVGDLAKCAIAAAVKPLRLGRYLGS